MNGARIRTLIVVVGLGFAATALGSACLDYAGEDFGVCDPAAMPVIPPTVGSGTGTGSSEAGVGSGSGTGAPTPAPTTDCGTSAPRTDSGGLGSGSGSAQP